MHDLLIAWPGGEARFSPDDSPVAVGRSADAAIVLTDPAISRRHLELVWLGSSWIANDSSTHGSFDPIGVRLAPTWTVGAEVTVRLGGVGGTEVRMALVDHLPRAEAPSETPADRPAAGAEPAPAGAQVAPAVQPAPPPHLEDPAGAAEQMPPGPAAGAGEPPPPDPGAHADGPPPPDSGAHADGPPPPDPGAHADGPPPPDPGAHADGPTPADPGVHGGDEPESWPGTAAPAPSPLSDSFPAAPAPVPPTPPPRPDDAPLEVAAASHQANGAESVAVAEQEVRGDAPPSPRDTQALAGRARSILEPAQQASPPAAERPPAGLRLGDPAAPAAAPDAPPPPSILAEPPAPAPQPPAPIDHQAPPAPEALVDNDPLAPPVPEPTAGPFDLQAPPAPEAPIDTDHQ
ncbi:MAG: FHA domain-containing protein, partial [Actinomycetota bacterium]